MTGLYTIRFKTEADGLKASASIHHKDNIMTDLMKSTIEEYESSDTPEYLNSLKLDLFTLGEVSDVMRAFPEETLIIQPIAEGSYSNAMCSACALPFDTRIKYGGRIYTEHNGYVVVVCFESDEEQILQDQSPEYLPF